MEIVLYHLPLWLSGPLIVLICVALGIGGVWIARRNGWQVSPDDNTGAGFLHAFVGMLYAVALGLLVVMVQEEYHDVEDHVLAEASAAGDVYRALEGLREPAKSGLRAELREYVRMTVEVEWPKTRRGGESPETWEVMDRLARHLVNYRPMEEEAALHDHLMGDLDEMLDARRARLFQGEQGIGGATWAVILLGGVVTLGFACAFHMQHARTQMVLTSATAAVYGLMLFLVLTMDHPLVGNFSVEPGPFEELRHDWGRIAGAPGDTMPGMKVVPDTFPATPSAPAPTTPATP